MARILVLNPIDRLIRRAIAERRLLKLTLNDRVRIVEPHDYGIKKGLTQLLAYQVAGESSSGGLPQWRWLQLSKMKNVELLDTHFAGGRETATGEHHGWDVLFARVESAPEHDAET
ncbi:hypothetical protein [Pendulispora albinea]|uniref:Uncharacterized protein n=1 Tax=Pendulispora albinea TaxID=2741071 RepID=A0ABZ2M5V7_9BACT